MRQSLPVFLLAALTAGAEPLPVKPRIELLELAASFGEHGNFRLGDLDGDGDEDLVVLPAGGLGYSEDPHGYWIENLGGRQYAEVRLCQISPTWRGEGINFENLGDLAGDGRVEFFGNHDSAAGHVPLAMVPRLDGLPLTEGTPLAAASAYPWRMLELDGDGRAELIQITEDGSGAKILQIYDRQVDGSYARTLSFPLPQGPVNWDQERIEVADIDGDGDRELLFLSAGAILERTGPRSFDPSAILIGSVDADFWLDVNGDGLPEWLDFGFGWHENLGSLSFAAGAEFPASSLVESIGIEARKLVSRPGQWAMLHAIVPNETGTSDYVTIPFDSAIPSFRQAIPVSAANASVLKLEDFDGDSHVDVMFRIRSGPYYFEGAETAICWGSPTGLSSPQVIFSTLSAFQSFYPGDFNGDGKADLIQGPDFEGRYRLRWSEGLSGLGEPEILTALQLPGIRSQLLGVADVDGDGRQDLVCECTLLPVTTPQPQTVTAVARGLANGDFATLELPVGSFETLLQQQLGGGGVQFIDWDGDGDLDLMIAGRWRENVGGSFKVADRVLIGLGVMDDFMGNPAVIGFTVTGDLDGDGAPEIISAAHGVGVNGGPPKKMAIAYNDGSGGLEAIAEVPAQIATSDFLGNPTTAGVVTVADLDLDGDGDLCIREISGTDFLGNPVVSQRWLRNPGNGSRDPASWVSLYLPDGPFPGYSLADFDGDGTSEWVDQMGYLKAAPGFPVSVSTFHFTGAADFSRQPSHAAADFDGDGDADFITGGGSYSPLLLIRNPVVNAQSAITRALIAAGAQASIANPELDADGDGRSNEDELMVGSNPLVADEEPFDPYLLRLNAGVGQAALSFKLPKTTALSDEVSTRDLEIKFVIERSSDLKDWTEVDRPDTGTSLDASWSSFNLPVACDGKQGFFRIRGLHRQDD